MRSQTIKSHDDKPLCIYEAGSGDEVLFIVNAPGMSIRFWTPIIEVLQKDYRVISMEYRSYPDSQALLQPHELPFHHYVDDLKRVLQATSVRQAHFLSWCLGSKLSFEIYRQLPDAVQSLFAVGISYTEHGVAVEGDFSRAVFDIKSRLATDPNAASKMIMMMSRIGLVPTSEFLETVLQEKSQDSTLVLMDMLECESSLSSLAFYLIDNEIGLKNYLNIYEEFRRHRIADLFGGMEIPVTVASGGKDKVTPINDELKADLFDLKTARYVSIPEASHFILLEYPSLMARKIREHVMEASCEHQRAGTNFAMTIATTT
jgi:pimeloyl-ACP methyl ester carboxylesterase